MTFQLKPFSTSQNPDVKFTVELKTQLHHLHFLFHLEGPAATLERLIWPKLETPAPQRKDGLWQTTAFELFIGPIGSTQYLEFNFSPSLDWNAYVFDSERQGMRREEKVQLNPVEHIHRTAHQCELRGHIDRRALNLTSDLEVSATAVLDWGSNKEYWAIAHKGTKPDFHLRQSFIAKLPTVQ